jgi:hypothetical protein
MALPSSQFYHTIISNYSATLRSKLSVNMGVQFWFYHQPILCDFQIEQNPIIGLVPSSGWNGMIPNCRNDCIDDVDVCTKLPRWCNHPWRDGRSLERENGRFSGRILPVFEIVRTIRLPIKSKKREKKGETKEKKNKSG